MSLLRFSQWTGHTSVNLVSAVDASQNSGEKPTQTIPLGHTKPKQVEFRSAQYAVVTVTHSQ